MKHVLIVEKAMSMEEESNTKEILRRIDDLSRILKLMLEDLNEISRMLRIYLEKHAETVLPPVTQRLITIEDVQKAFPQDLLELLYFEVLEDYIVIKPRQYLGSENFVKIASIVREQLKGEYVSHGKESHFRIPRRIT